MSRLARFSIALGVAAGLLMPMSVRADRAQDDARRAVEHGEALPLTALLSRVQPQLAGEVVGVTFERKHGRWIYEFKVVGQGGRLEEIRVDAASAEIVDREEH